MAISYDPLTGAREATWAPGGSPERDLTEAFLRYCNTVPKRNRNFASCVRQWAQLRIQAEQSVDPEGADAKKMPPEFRKKLQEAFASRF